jgi:hypothetical protein
MKQIKLLDGSVFDQSELIDNMYDDDFYYGYLDNKALSSSRLSRIMDSPKTDHYIMKHGSPSTQALTDGHLFHTMILEPEKLSHYVFLNVESKNTKAYKEACAYHTDVYTSKEKRDAERLVDAIFRNEIAKQYLTDASFEVPMIDYIQDTPFRGKADILKNDGMIVDLKTTIGVKHFDISAEKYGYHRQCYIYCKLFDVPPEGFVFLCVDKKNLDIGIFDCSQEFYDKGQEEVEILIEKFWQTTGNPDFEIDDYVLRGTL